MRELKFRVWSEEDKQYRTDCNVCELFNGKTGCPATIYNDEGDRFDIEQYTGLKDKNGKEIYEGDIAIGHTPYYIETFEIAWREDKAGWFGFAADDYTCPLCNIEHLEAIGNIHENAGLLEDKE